MENLRFFSKIGFQFNSETNDKCKNVKFSLNVYISMNIIYKQITFSEYFNLILAVYVFSVFIFFEFFFYKCQ